MKTLITATAITLATAAAAMAGPYAGVEYNSMEITAEGYKGNVQVSGPRLYVGAKTEMGDTTLYGEVGYYDYEAEISGADIGSEDDMDWKIGVDHKVSDSVTLYGSYGSMSAGPLDVAETQIGVRWEF